METNFKVGDKIRIVNYGHRLWWHKSDWEKYKNTVGSKMTPYANSEDGKILFFDLAPEKIGREDVIIKHTESQPNFHQYALEKNGAWFSPNQLELINDNNG